MNRSMVIIVCLSITAGFILANALNRSSVGQPLAPAAAEREGRVWRYQLSQSSEGRLPAFF